MRAFRLLALAAAVSLPSVARADGLIYTLPKDGAEAVYDFKAVHNDKSSGMERKFDGTLTIASVGTEKVDGKACRWIELRFVMRFMGKERINMAKLLIPESDIGKGKFMLGNIKKGWENTRGKTRKFNSPLESRGNPIPAFLPEPLSDVKKLKAAEVKTGVGKLKCEGLTGKSSYEQGDDMRKDRFDSSYVIRLNKKSPFGVAYCKIKMQEYRNKTMLDDQIEIEFTLKSVGTGAKSKITPAAE